MDRRTIASQTSYLKAIDQSPQILSDPTAGWSEVDVRRIRGNHISCAREHIGSLGVTLRDCLQEAQRSGRPTAAAADGDGSHTNSHGCGE